METLLGHRTIRKYQDKDVPDGLLKDLVNAGTRASNTGNMQLYSVIVTRSDEKKARLSPLHFNQPMVKTAPVVLTICLDLNRYSKWCRINNADAGVDNLLWLMNGTVDSMLFAQNICIAAESAGLGICYLGTTLYNAPEIIAVLDLPKGVIPVTAITLGYPAEVPPLTDRLPLDAVIHQETYKDYSDAEIRALYRDKEELESSRKFVAENNKENLAQVYAGVRYKKADSEFFSAKLRTLFEEQGFL